jgi:hypothetical protein
VPDVAVPAEKPRSGRRRAPEAPVDPVTEPLPVIAPIEPRGRHSPPPEVPSLDRPTRRPVPEEPLPAPAATNGAHRDPPTRDRTSVDHGELGRYQSVWDYNASPEYRPVEEYYVTPEHLSAPERAAETGPIPVYEESPSGRHRRPV